MNRMNNIFIVNPNSGDGKSITAANIISNFCDANRIKYSVFYAETEQDAIDLARKYSCNGNVIHSVGGDGTINAIVNGMIYSDAYLSIIPTGINNNFYKSTQLTNKDFIDLGKVNDRLFLNIATIGMNIDALNLLKNKQYLSRLKLELNLLNSIKNFKCYDVKLNDIEKRFFYLSICNGQYSESGLKIAPDANLSDSFFDVCEIESMSKLSLLKLLSKLLNNMEFLDKKIHCYKCDELIIESKEPLICNVDGELIESTNFNFSVNPEAILYQKNDSLKIKELLYDKHIIK